MSMDHKAFVFDDDAFRSELRGLLERALQHGDIAPLRAFIETHRGELSDPYEGAPLDRDWESQVEIKDAHQYGDFALTKYYEPADDVGLGADWQALGEGLCSHGFSEHALLGTPLASFDPGKQGSYFQSPATVRENLRRVEELIATKPALAGQLAALRSMLDAAARRAMGLYITV
jgi:hypothetical protein